MSSKILVVDDEPVICYGIKSMIERMDDLPQLEVFLAFSAREALSICKKIDLDIVVTDVRMAEATGIELIRDISSVYPSVSFIVISGYDNFDYVKAAFKLGTIDYLLKPVDIEELREAIIAAIRRNKYVEYKDVLLENSLRRIITGRINNEDILKIKGSFAYRYFCIADVSCKRQIEFGEINDAIDVLSKEIQSVIHTIKLFCLYDEKIKIIFNLEHEKSYNELKDFFVKIKTKRFMKNKGIVISLSDLGELNSLQSLYAQTEEIAAYKIMNNFDNFITSDILNKKTSMIDSKYQEELLNKFSRELTIMNVYNMLKSIDEIFSVSRLTGYSIEDIKKSYNRIINLLSEKACKDGVNLSPGIYRDFSSFFSLEEVKAYLKNEIRYLNYALNSSLNIKGVIETAEDYIMQNYNKDIDLATVANMVSMNYYYFSKLFKDKTGVSFSEYITRLRMEEARKLLNDPSNKINEIAAKVGYKNPKHFTNTFKKYFGKAPRQYRLQ